MQGADSPLLKRFIYIHWYEAKSKVVETQNSAKERRLAFPEVSNFVLSCPCIRSRNVSVCAHVTLVDKFDMEDAQTYIRAYDMFLASCRSALTLIVHCMS